jgi:hypothetical protein
MDIDEQPNILINVFQFPLLTQDQCENITKIILNNINNYPHYGSMQKHTVDITTLLADFIQDYIPLITSKINEFYDFGKKIPYFIYTAHSILYKANGAGEKALSIHTDDSDITVNIPIHMKDLLGSELRFMGSTPYGNSIYERHFEKYRIKDPIAVNSISHKLGSYVIHRGEHPHETSAIYNGERIALVFWLKRFAAVAPSAAPAAPSPRIYNFTVKGDDSQNPSPKDSRE